MIQYQNAQIDTKPHIYHQRRCQNLPIKSKKREYKQALTEVFSLDKSTDRGTDQFFIFLGDLHLLFLGVGELLPEVSQLPLHPLHILLCLSLLGH